MRVTSGKAKTVLANFYDAVMVKQRLNADVKHELIGECKSRSGIQIGSWAQSRYVAGETPCDSCAKKRCCKGNELQRRKLGIGLGLLRVGSTSRGGIWNSLCPCKRTLHTTEPECSVFYFGLIKGCPFACK